MHNDPIPPECVAEYLSALKREQEEVAEIIRDAETLAARARSLRHALGRYEIAMPSPHYVHVQVLNNIFEWVRTSLLPGHTVPINEDEVYEAMGFPRRYMRGERPIESLTPEALMTYLLATYGPRAAELARANLRLAVDRAVWLNRTREERGTLVLHIGARSEATYGGGRAIRYEAATRLQTALDAVTRAVAFDGGPLPAIPGALAFDDAKFQTSIGDEFRYRAKIPVALGHLVLFKDHVDLVLHPQVAQAFALFLATTEDESLAA
jgi:hypothetical protein